MNAERWRDVSRLYHAALTHAAFLAEACAGDSVLRQEVESLLAQENAASEFLEQPATAVAQSQAGGQPWSIGRQIGHYRIAGELGTGGMGIVY
jgi:serine/threonine-protein kinase